MPSTPSSPSPPARFDAGQVMADLDKERALKHVDNLVDVLYENAIACLGGEDKLSETSLAEIRGGMAYIKSVLFIILENEYGPQDAPDQPARRGPLTDRRVREVSAAALAPRK